jgi:uncharacterized iron-regulated protein
MSQASFQKQQRERARKEKAALKAARKEERRAEAGTEDDAAPTTETDQAKVLESLAALHARFEDGGMTFEDFEAARDELTARLSV